ncbi:Hypothetical protein, putative [Bodo saltans]|uniref:Uncharacterized protein n=1 Tax=Bodo saltans TaxID=75058 RepID=A0A0S4IH73_BODSA|nr:Hypothetical protein, putative [Bodo saltans]|eukprot:CUE59234.1 Hypothetical protein, putative [Bodo saltans]
MAQRQDHPQKPSYGYESQKQQRGNPHSATTPIGVGGLPYAVPAFRGEGENSIRHPHPCCCGIAPGPKIPLHWYEGGEGWVTKYFYDYVPRHNGTQEPGTFRCQVKLVNGQLCNHEIAEGDCCKGNCCWKSSSTAPGKMAQHLRSAHNLSPPSKRPWSSSFVDIDGCGEAVFCPSCIGSRQVMALAGWEDKFHFMMCIFLALQPHAVQGAAMCTRMKMASLNNINESCCQACLTGFICPICSVAQTYRELTSSGVWPGSNCGQHRPYPQPLAMS